MDESRTPNLDDVDRALLRLLVEDGRRSIHSLAEEVHVSRATAYSRLERLRSCGVVRAVRAELDPALLGLGIAALILLNVDQHAWPDVRDDLIDLPGLEYLAFTSGGFDLAIVVRVPDIETLRDVVLVRLHGSPQIRSTQTIFVLDELRVPLRPPEPVTPERPRGAQASVSRRGSGQSRRSARGSAR